MENKEFKPYVPAEKQMTEFTIRAFVLGLFMSVILGAANAYLGLRAGMTIAATYPAAVISMAVLRFFRGSILEENLSRTVGSIGESVAAGAIFTIPAFIILGLWDFRDLTMGTYLKASALMMVGGVLGILFVAILRRMMVEDRDLKFPESVAAAEIHKAGQRGGEAARELFIAMGIGAFVKLLADFKFFEAARRITLEIGTLGKSIVRFGTKEDSFTVNAGGVSYLAAPEVAPAYLGVGYIIGPELGALNFAGSLLAWGLMVPVLVFFLGPNHFVPWAQAQGMDPVDTATWFAFAKSIWRNIVQPIAVGGMLVGAFYTLYRMRQKIGIGLKRAMGDLAKSAASGDATIRTDKDLSFKTIALGILCVFLMMVALYFKFSGTLSGALFAAIVMLVTGFFFAAVSGNLVGMIGSSNNPVSGLTLATLLIAGLVIVLIGLTGGQGIAAVLGVAAVGCVSSAVAGEMLQDLKVGHILGGTPWKMQVGNMISGVIAGAVMVLPIYLLYVSNIGQGGTGFGDARLSAPQAGLMAMLSQGIVTGQIAWPLVLVGVALGISMILIKVRSPMLFSVGMYLPMQTTAAIFVGGLIRGVADWMAKRRNLNEAQKVRMDNTGVLVASGLIAGEALMGLLLAGYVFWRLRTVEAVSAGTEEALQAQMWWSHEGVISTFLAVLVVIGLAAYFVFRSLAKAGNPDEPPPPAAVM